VSLIEPKTPASAPASIVRSNASLQLRVVWGGKFIKAFSANGGRMQLDLTGLSRFTPVEAPERLPAATAS